MHYYGSHRNGKDCPCGPTESARQKNGKWSMFLIHRAPEEELDLTEQEVMDKVSEAMRRYNEQEGVEVG